MWKKLLALAVSAGIIAGGASLYRNRHRLFRPDFQRTGGTLLVYEIDGEPPAGGLDGAVAVLQRRFDPSGALGITVRATDDGEVELAVPAGPRHDEQVDQVKRIIDRAGRLEFLILARTGDDDPAIRAATLALKDPAARGLVPPPAPKGPRGQALIATTLPGEPEYRYRWVRLGRSELMSLQLDDAALRRHNFLDAQRVAASLKTGEAFAPTQATELLLAARQVPGSADPVFFALAREEPEDRAVTGGHVERASAAQGQYGRHQSITIRLDREGGLRLLRLTSQNLAPRLGPRGWNRLAILLDGEALAAPAFDAPLRTEARVVGDFTTPEADDLVALIRGGTLPVRLKPRPAREVAVEPRR